MKLRTSSNNAAASSANPMTRRQTLVSNPAATCVTWPQRNHSARRLQSGKFDFQHQFEPAVTTEISILSFRTDPCTSSNANWFKIFIDLFAVVY